MAGQKEGRVHEACWNNMARLSCNPWEVVLGAAMLHELN